MAKIKSLTRVDVPGADLNAAIPISVKSKNSKTPHAAPIISPFFASFFAAVKPAKKAPAEMAIEETTFADESGRISKDIRSAKNTNKKAITAIPIIRPNTVGFMVVFSGEEFPFNPDFIKKSSKEILLLNNISLEGNLLLICLFIVGIVVNGEVCLNGGTNDFLLASVNNRFNNK